MLALQAWAELIFVGIGTPRPLTAGTKKVHAFFMPGGVPPEFLHIRQQVEKQVNKPTLHNIMDKEKKNEELLSRRGFFKKAAAAALPILAATAFLSNPVVAKAAEPEIGTDAESNQCTYGSCAYSCSGSCSGSCSSSCGMGCSGSCKGGCGGCKGACRSSCSNACKGYF